jgi:glutathione S-transferase
MTLEIHWVSGSPYAWRVLLALELKGIAYVSRLRQLSTGELGAPDYLAMNPRGKVPTVRDGEYVVYESLAILAYLERKHPDPPLFGRTAEEHGTIWRIASEYTAYLDPAVEALILPIYAGEILGREAELRRAADVIRSELATYEALAARAPWLAGDAVSAADLVFYPALRSIERSAEKEIARPLELELVPMAPRWPALAAWRERMERLAGHERTVPPHWR